MLLEEDSTRNILDYYGSPVITNAFTDVKLQMLSIIEHFLPPPQVHILVGYSMFSTTIKDTKTSTSNMDDCQQAGARGVVTWTNTDVPKNGTSTEIVDTAAFYALTNTQFKIAGYVITFGDHRADK